MALENSLHGLLCGTSGYALYLIPPQDYPFAWTACALGFTHGLLGLIKAAKADDDNVKKVTEWSEMAMEYLPVPLVNIDLYLNNSTNNIALGHGLCFVPLLFNPLVEKYSGDGEEDNKPALEHLTILGNIMSLVYLAVNECDCLYGGMAVIAFMTKYGAMFAEEQGEGNGKVVALLGHTIFFYLTAMAIAAIGMDA